QSGGGDDVRRGVAVDVVGPDPDAAGKGRREGEELRPQPAQAAEHPHVRPAAGPGPGDDLTLAVPGQVGGRDGDAAVEPRVVGEEAGQGRAGGPVERLDVRPAAGPGPGVNVAVAGARRVADGDADPAAEAGGVG